MDLLTAMNALSLPSHSEAPPTPIANAEDMKWDLIQGDGFYYYKLAISRTQNVRGLCQIWPVIGTVSMSAMLSLYRADLLG